MPRTYGGDAGDDGMQTQFSLSQAKICNLDAMIALRQLESTRVQQQSLARILLFMGFHLPGPLQVRPPGRIYGVSSRWAFCVANRLLMDDSER